MITRRRSLGTALLALLAAFSLLIAGAVPAQAAKGSSFSKSTWTTRNVDTTLGYGESTFKVHIKDKTPISSAYLVLESSKFDYRTVHLGLIDGSNRNGQWTSDVYFGNQQTGTWRVTQLVTTNQDGYVYTEKKASGIGGKVKVKAGPKTKLKLATSKKVIAGSKAKYSATLTRKGKALKGAKVTFGVSYTDSKGKYKYKTYKAKTNKKGVATVKKKFPAISGKMSVYANYEGRARTAQPSYAKSKTVKRAWKTAKLKVSAPKTAVAGSKKKVSVKLTKGKKSFAKQKVTVTVTGKSTGSVKTLKLKTNKKGKASGTFTMPGEDVKIKTSYASAKYKAKTVKSSAKVTLKLTLKLDATTAPDSWGTSYATISLGSTVRAGRVALYAGTPGNERLQDYTNLADYPRSKETFSFSYDNEYKSTPAKISVYATWEINTSSYYWSSSWSVKQKSNTVTLTIPADDDW